LSGSPSPSPAASLTISAPSGTNIASIDYANIGESTGVCGSFTDGKFSLYPNSNVQRLISTSCVGNSTCTLPLTTTTFGTMVTPSNLGATDNAAYTQLKNNSQLQVQYRNTIAASSPS
jgi:hypothetical protein